MSKDVSVSLANSVDAVHERKEINKLGLSIPKLYGGEVSDDKLTLTQAVTLLRDLLGEYC